jgi:hypothetical protein
LAPDGGRLGDPVGCRYATLATIRARLSEVEVLYIAVGPGGLQDIEPEHSDYAPR